MLLAVEVDGYRWHSSRERWEADRCRDRALPRLGWLVLRVTADDRRRAAASVIRDLAAHLAVRAGSSGVAGRRLHGHDELGVPPGGLMASA